MPHLRDSLTVVKVGFRPRLIQHAYNFSVYPEVEIGSVSIVLLRATLLLYAIARVSQLFADRLPSILIVLLHVVPPAVFALVHGRALYGRAGIIRFVVICLTIGGIFESLSLRTGFPFGHYVFTGVMGPKLLGLPYLLVLAYLGIGYTAWVLSLTILGYRKQPLIGPRLLAQPLLATVIMLAWDLSMEAVWATVDKAWIWRDGGAWFGVPVSNFFGWFLTALTQYLLFALSQRGKLANPRAASFWRLPVLLYMICAAGNLLILRLPMATELVTDATGKLWFTHDILALTAVISIAIMLPLAALALLRLHEERPGAT